MGQDPRKGAKKPTIYSIAQELGVHASTVSRAISRPAMVRPEMREKVLAKAAELKFELNPVARGLTTGRTGTLGLLIPDIENPYFVPVMRSIQSAAADAGLRTLLMDSQLQSSVELELVAQVRAQVDGLILVSPRSSVEQLLNEVDDQSMVLVNRAGEGVASVMVDMGDALYAAGRHLEDLGHRRIGLLVGPMASWAARQRAEAVRSWASARPVELVEFGPAEASFEGGRVAGTAVRDSGVTAVFTFDDLSACGLVAGLVAAGASIPQDISIVGADDVLLASVITPSLSTIRVPYDELGASAIRLMTEQLQGVGDGAQVTLFGEFIPRESTCSVRTA